MPSPAYPPYRLRMPPPVRPSRSLEGLEQVIPPKMPLSPLSPTFLNKPLPAKPLPETPPENIAIWSDSSDSESTVDSVDDPSEPRDSTESHLIFVSSGSDDFGDLVDHPSAPADPHQPKLHQKHHYRITASPRRSHPVEDSCSASITTQSSPIQDAQYGRLNNWSENRPGTNHYFREKKWDFFPELAPAAVHAGNRMNANKHNAKRRKKDGRLHLSALDFSKSRHHWHSLDLPQVRDSIKTYVHRTISKGSTEDNKPPKQAPRPATAPMGSPYARSSSHRSEDTVHRLGIDKGHSSLDVSVRVRALSISTHSSTNTFCESTHSTPTPHRRQKQLAVPLLPYQKYGATVWEASKKSSKKRNVRFPKHHHQRQRTTVATSSSALAAKPLPPLSPPLRMQLQQALQDGTGQVLIALDGAKKKMTESKEDRRREHLKSQIKLVGPVNPHTCVQVDPWG